MHKLQLFAALFMVGAGAAMAQPLSPEPPEPPQTTLAHIPAMGGSYLGVNVREIDSERSKQLKLREEAGVELTRVEDDSPAAKAGLKVGDVVLQYNGQRVEGMEQFSRFIRETPPGREVRLTISRDGATQTVAAKIGSRKTWFGPTSMSGMPRIEVAPLPPMPDLPRSVMMWRTASLGIEAEALHGQMADFFGAKEGVLVRSVLKETAAAKAGLKAGDVILRVGDAKVATPNEVSSAVRAMHDRKTFPVTVLRERKEMTLSVTVDDDRSDWNFSAPRINERQIRRM